MMIFATARKQSIFVVLQSFALGLFATLKHLSCVLFKTKPKPSNLRQGGSLLFRHSAVIIYFFSLILCAEAVYGADIAIHSALQPVGQAWSRLLAASGDLCPIPLRAEPKCLSFKALASQVVDEGATSKKPDRNLTLRADIAKTSQLVPLRDGSSSSPNNNLRPFGLLPKRPPASLRNRSRLTHFVPKSMPKVVSSSQAANAFYVSVFTGSSTAVVQAYDTTSGELLGTLSAPVISGDSTGLAFGPNGNLFVGSTTGTVLEYSAADSIYQKIFANNPSGVSDMSFGPDNNLYLIGGDFAIQKINGSTGANLGAFARGSAFFPSGMTFGPDGNIYVTNLTRNTVDLIDRITGQIQTVLTGIAAPLDLTFNANGTLYVISGNAVLWFSQTESGVFISTGLNAPISLAFGPDGNLYVTDSGNNTVQKFDGTNGALLRTFSISGTPRYITFGSVTSPGPTSAPTISSFTPTSGAVGTEVTLTGTGLSTVFSATIGGVGVLEAGFLSDTQLILLVPSGALSGPITVTNPNGTATSATSFTVTGGGNPSAPTISSFTPTSGAVGTEVTLTGTGLSTVFSATIGGVGVLEAGFLSDTQLILLVPSGALSGPITVTNPNGTATSATSFTVTGGGNPSALKGDFNADGKTDILWRNKATGQNTVWLMNGVTLLEPKTLSPVSDPNWEIRGPR
jgi:streptogramin lyase